MMGYSLSLAILVLIVFANVANSKSHSRRYNKLKNDKRMYLKWVKTMSSRNHSIFQEAKNKFQPCKTIKVHKNPKYGDYTTVKQAINSIPLYNPCRVVVYVSPGTYK